MSDIEPVVNALLAEAFGQHQRPDQASSDFGPFDVVSISDANQGRGVFSEVLRAELRWLEERGPEGQRPASAVVKVPIAGPNGAAAAASGAYAREALVYRRVLPTTPVAAPLPYLVKTDGELASFVLEDLRNHRWVDQLDGLDADDAFAVVDQLAVLHEHWRDRHDLTKLHVRRSTPAGLAVDALERGLAQLDDRWGEDVEPEQLAAFRRLVARRDDVVEAFVKQEPATLCHGDPRADNLVFAADGHAVLYDWQQPAIQFGAADIAWLAATSLTPDNRRLLDADLQAHYGVDEYTYRVGFVLPGLAVLLLAQREVVDQRSRAFIATSLARIGTALCDLDVPEIREGNPRG